VRIVIVGGGVVGFSLARQLLHDKHTVSLIEQTPEIAEHIAEKMDLQVLSGSGTSPTVLQQAGIESADMVIAVTPVDEINILVCSIARQYGVTQRIARLRNREFISPDRHVSLIDLGVTQFIFPEQVVVDSILQYIDTPGAREAVNFENGNIFLRGYDIEAGMPMVGKSLIELRRRIEPNIFLVAAVIREGKGIIPPGDFVIEAGDKVFSLFPREVAPKFLELINESPAPVKRVIITGNNLSTMQLASAIQEKVPTLILVDSNKEHAELMAAELSKTDVIFGDCTEADTLKEMDIAVSMEEKQDHLFHSIGIDHVINPRVTAAKEIMQIISRGYFGSVVRLGDAEIEAVGMTIPENSKVAGVPLKKAWKKIRTSAIIGIIIRGYTMIIPDGETILEGNDHIITIAYTRTLPTIRKLFKSSN
jgi:trk system potassium uptake protein TrkA